MKWNTNISLQIDHLSLCLAAYLATCMQIYSTRMYMWSTNITQAIAKSQRTPMHVFTYRPVDKCMNIYLLGNLVSCNWELYVYLCIVKALMVSALSRGDVIVATLIVPAMNQLCVVRYGVVCDGYVLTHIGEEVNLGTAMRIVLKNTLLCIVSSHCC